MPDSVQGGALPAGTTPDDSALRQLALDLEVPLRELRQGITVLEILGTRKGYEADAIDFVFRGLLAAWSEINATYQAALTATQAGRTHA